MTTESNVIPNEKAEMYFDIFVTALEGGIGYWSVCEEYQWRRKFVPTTEPGAKITVAEESDIFGFYAVVRDEEDPVDGEPRDWRIDHGTIEKGIAKAFQYAVENGRLSDYNFVALAKLKHGRFDNLDFDAETADIIVQFGLFGELVYG